MFFSTRNSQEGQEEKGMHCLKFSTWNQSSTSMVSRIAGSLGFVELHSMANLYPKYYARLSNLKPKL